MMIWKHKNNEADWHMVRETVFVEEQGFEHEFDDIDDKAQHITLYINDMLAGCVRYYQEDGAYRIGRLAVLPDFRKQGCGGLLLEHAEEEIKTRGGNEVYLDAQYRVKEFYEKEGYVVCGKEHMDEHVPHVLMKKKL